MKMLREEKLNELSGSNEQIIELSEEELLFVSGGHGYEGFRPIANNAFKREQLKIVDINSFESSSLVKF